MMDKTAVIGHKVFRFGDEVKPEKDKHYLVYSKVRDTGLYKFIGSGMYTEDDEGAPWVAFDEDSEPWEEGDWTILVDAGIQDELDLDRVEGGCPCSIGYEK